jgi:hypothetical protein
LPGIRSGTGTSRHVRDVSWTCANSAMFVLNRMRILASPGGTTTQTGLGHVWSWPVELQMTSWPGTFSRWCCVASLDVYVVHAR